MKNNAISDSALLNGAAKITVTKNDAIGILKKQRKNVSELWVNSLLQDPNLRDDLITNDDLKSQSEELIYSFVDSLNDQSIEDGESEAFERVNEILSGISVSRAKRGFSSRETGIYILSLKNAISSVLQRELNAPALLYD